MVESTASDRGSSVSRTAEPCAVVIFGASGDLTSALGAARENCRTVRDVLPRSSWEAINELYLYAKENVQSGLTKRGRYDFLDEIIAGSQRIAGLLGSVMYRDEAYQCSRIGRNLERADMTTRIIDVRSTDLFPDDQLETRSLDTLQWISVLRSMSGYQIYRRHVAIRVNRGDVLGFLFQNPLYPRSFLHCVEAVEESIAELDTRSPALRRCRALRRKTRQTNVAELGQASLHAFIDELQVDITAMHNALAEAYFLPEMVEEEKSA